MIRPVPGNGTLNRPAGGLEPPVQIGTGPHESVFNDCVWGDCVHKGKVGGVPGLVRGGTEDARFDSGSLGGD